MTQRLIAVAIGISVVMSCAAAEAKSRVKKTHLKATAYSTHHHYRTHQRTARSYGKRHRHAKRTLRGYAVSGMSTDRSCLTPAAKSLLARIEANFGRVQLVSTCRRGATIAGTSHPSMHRYGMAFDFKTPQKAAVVRWLAQNNTGGTMTYRNSDHIHADVGRYHFVSLAGSRSRVASRASRRTTAVASVVQQPSDLAAGSGYSDGAPVVQQRVVTRASRHRTAAYGDGRSLVMYRPVRGGKARQVYELSAQRMPNRQTHSAM